MRGLNVPHTGAAHGRWRLEFAADGGGRGGGDQALERGWLDEMKLVTPVRRPEGGRSSGAVELSGGGGGVPVVA